MADAEQQAVIAQILNQSPGHTTETQQASIPSPTPAPTEVKAPPAEQVVEPPKAPSKSKSQEIIERLMQQTREGREKQLAEQQHQQALEYARRIQEARDYGPDAVLKAAGINQPKIDIARLLDPEPDDEPKSVKELKGQVSQLDEYIKQLKQEREQEKQTFQQQQMSSYQERELGGISQFIEQNSKDVQYVAATKPLGSDKDLYNGMVSMYNQGVQPTYKDMAELVESRIEDLLNAVAGTEKFANFVHEKFGAKIGAKRGESPTLTGSMTGDTPAEVNPNETDEENKARALKAAYAAREKLLSQMKAT